MMKEVWVRMRDEAGMNKEFANMTDEEIYKTYLKEESELLMRCISKGDEKLYQEQSVLLLEKYRGTIVEKLEQQESADMRDEKSIAEYMIKQAAIGERYDGAIWDEKMAELAEQYKGTIVEKYLREAEEDLDAEEDWDEEPLSIEEIMQMEDAGDFTIAYMDYLNDKCEYGGNIEALTEKEKTVYYVDTMNSEVHSKGMKEYLRSDEFPGFEQLENALKELGANEVYEILQDAKKKPKWMSFDKIDDRFYEYPDKLEHLIMDYVKE